MTIEHPGRRPPVTAALLLAAIVLLPGVESAQARAASAPFPSDPLASVPVLAPMAAARRSELADVVQRFRVDQTALGRRYDAFDPPDQRTRHRSFHTAWRTRLRMTPDQAIQFLVDTVNFERANAEGEVR